MLKGRSRRLTAFIVSLFFGWYLLYVVASAFARDLMAYRLFGNVNVALVFGVLQFVGAFVLAWRYSRHSREVLDPLAAQIVADAERRVGEAVRHRAAAASSESAPPPVTVHASPGAAAHVRPGTVGGPWTGGGR